MKNSAPHVSHAHQQHDQQSNSAPPVTHSLSDSAPDTAPAPAAVPVPVSLYSVGSLVYYRSPSPKWVHSLTGLLFEGRVLRAPTSKNPRYRLKPIGSKQPEFVSPEEIFPHTKEFQAEFKRAEDQFRKRNQPESANASGLSLSHSSAGQNKKARVPPSFASRLQSRHAELESASEIHQKSKKTLEAARKLFQTDFQQSNFFNPHQPHQQPLSFSARSKSADKSDSSVVIIGAGPAGLMAARSLIQNFNFPPSSISIVEARHRIGGRVSTSSVLQLITQFKASGLEELLYSTAESRSANDQRLMKCDLTGLVEFGAAFIHGFDKNHPIHPIDRRYQLLKNYFHEKSEGVECWLDGGNKIPQEKIDEIRRFYGEVSNELAEIWKEISVENEQKSSAKNQSSIDRTLEFAISEARIRVQNRWKADGIHEFDADFMKIFSGISTSQHGYVAELRSLSLNDTVNGVSCTCKGQIDYACVSGFKFILDLIASEIGANSEGEEPMDSRGVKIFFDAPVKQIRQIKRTQNGRESENESESESSIANQPPMDEDSQGNNSLLETDTASNAANSSQSESIEIGESDSAQSAANGFPCYSSSSSLSADSLVNSVLSSSVSHLFPRFDEFSAVEISTVDGRKFFADAVISTIPLECMKQGDIEFSPPLPEFQRISLDRLSGGVENKLILVWPPAEIEWIAQEKSLFGDRIQFFRSAENPFFKIVNLISMNLAAGVIYVQTAPPIANRFDSAANSPQAKYELFREIFDAVKAIFGPKQQFSDPAAVFLTDWGANSYSRMSYSYIPVHSSTVFQEFLSRPFHRLAFAGEHTHRDDSQTVHGAMLSGERAAREIARAWESQESKQRLDDRQTRFRLECKENQSNDRTHIN